MNESRENIQFLREFLATRASMGGILPMNRSHAARTDRYPTHARTHATRTQIQHTHTQRRTLATTTTHHPSPIVIVNPRDPCLVVAIAREKRIQKRADADRAIDRRARAIGSDRLDSDRTRGVIIPPSLPPSRMRAHAHTHGARTPSCMRYDPWVRT